MFPLVQNQEQISFLFQANGINAHLFQRLKQTMQSQLYGNEALQNKWWSYFHRLMLQQPSLKDEVIYDQLCAFWKSDIVGSKEYKTADEEGRSKSRVNDIIELLQKENKLQDIHTFLDLGCAEASISAALAKTLKIDLENAHGCDIKPLSHAPQITFCLLETSTLPYSDESFDLVLALMSFHHIKHVEETMSEIYRILKPNGILLFREHDLYTPSLTVLLDVLHGLYDRVWTSDPLKTFCSEYAAWYRPRQEWMSLLQKAGFEAMEHSPDRDGNYVYPLAIRKFQVGRIIRNPYAFYYGLYRKTATLHKRIKTS